MFDLHAVANLFTLPRLKKVVRGVLAREAEFQGLPDSELRKRALALRYRAKSGESLDLLLPETYALVREVSSRTLGLRHFDVQLLGGVALHHRSIAEMETGEGKTLTATLPTVLHAWRGRGAHVATANDYLATRDAESMRPLYEALGLSVGALTPSMPSTKRRDAYQCDITYATAKEFGFDFLRDRLQQRAALERQSDSIARMLGQDAADNPHAVQRIPPFVLIDEADSILIDEARTPLIISATAAGNASQFAQCLQWSAAAAPHFREETHYTCDRVSKAVALTAGGRQLARSHPKPLEMGHVNLYVIYQAVERAILVERNYQRDRHYVIRNSEVVIVDEFTGRLAEGRKWRGGIHQAVEAKEGLKLSGITGHAAQITLQEFFTHYDRLAGMTGTARSAAPEVRKVYRMQVLHIPTHRTSRRERWPDRIFGTAEAKWQAIVAEIRELHAAGRPVLVGTRSIDKSEQLASLLKAENIVHQVLHARQLAAEAEVVTLAGHRGCVTVATNMAGRGTDIKLGPGVAELGGLHVIGSEMHDSARIDRQLMGRCGRQGDPGSFRQFLSLDDDILLGGLGPAEAERLHHLGQQDAVCFDHLGYLFRRAQAGVERKHFCERHDLLVHVTERKRAQIRMGQDPYLDAIG